MTNEQRFPLRGKLVDIIAGARPNFIKIAPIIDAMRDAVYNDKPLRYRLIHTGQHYDNNMSGTFFHQLGIPEPDVNLGVGSGTAAEQTAAIMTRYERVLLERKSDLCLVVGDVTSTMACAIAAQKLAVRVAHVEGGIRSGDWSMPEEINRLITDSISNYFFTTSDYANANLRNAGIPEERIFFVGNTMIDTLLKQRPRFFAPAIWSSAKLEARHFFVLTLHRPANVTSPTTLGQLLREVIEGVRGLPVIFPVHPRTATILRNVSIEAPNLHLVEPLTYLEFNYLVERALAVITDSGGITEETTVLGIPCLTLRDTTERPETVAMGSNVLVGTRPGSIAPHLGRLFTGNWKPAVTPPLWDGQTGSRIVAHLQKLLT